MKRVPRKQCPACGKLDRHAQQCPVLQAWSPIAVPCSDCGGEMRPLRLQGTLGAANPFVFRFFDEDAELGWVEGSREIAGYVRAEMCVVCRRVRFYGVPTRIEQDTVERLPLPIPATSPQPSPETLPLPASDPATEGRREQ